MVNNRNHSPTSLVPDNQMASGVEAGMPLSRFDQPPQTSLIDLPRDLVARVLGRRRACRFKQPPRT